LKAFFYFLYRRADRIFPFFLEESLGLMKLFVGKTVFYNCIELYKKKFAFGLACTEQITQSINVFFTKQ